MAMHVHGASTSASCYHVGFASALEEAHKPYGYSKVAMVTAKQLWLQQSSYGYSKVGMVTAK